MTATDLSLIRTHLAQVSAVCDLRPDLRRVTVAGDDLRSFVPNGPDCFAFLLLPPPGRTELGIDHGFTWEQHRVMAPADKPVGAYYTISGWRPEAGEVDVTMVLHGDGGSASAWGRRARRGDCVALWGPRTAFDPPADTTHVLVVADDAGLPAAAGIIAATPADIALTVVAEVDNAHMHQALPSHPALDVRWCHRQGSAPGTTTLLADAVASMPALPPTTYAYGGAENRAVTDIRRHLHDERRLSFERISMVAYWHDRDERSI